MPGKEGSVEAKAKTKKNRKAKRPATSPLSDTSVQCTDSADTQHRPRDVSKARRKTVVSEENTQSIVGKQTPQTFPNLSPSEPTDFYNVNMAYAPPYGLPQTPYMQSPPYNVSQQSSQPPAWALELLDEIKHIKTKMQAVEKIESTVTMINAKMTKMEENMKSLEARVTENEKSCEFINNSTETQKAELKRANEELNKMAKTCKSVEEKVTSLEREKTDLEAKVLDLESRSMRENLVFYGIAEGGDQENCEDVVKDLCKNILKMDNADKLVFDRIHRVGAKQAKPRPIVTKFHYYSEREQVRQRSFDYAADLKSRRVGVGIQLPWEIREARKSLYGPMKKAKAEGKRTKFVGKKLYINGEEFVGH